MTRLAVTKFRKGAIQLSSSDRAGLATAALVAPWPGTRGATVRERE